MYKSNVDIRKKRRARIRKKVRKKIRGTGECPRVHVFKSNKYIYTQVINDDSHEVLTAASTLEKEFREKSKNFKNTKATQALGEMLVKRIKKKKVKNVVFDRGIYPYKGRIKTLTDTIRKGGITF